MSPGELLQSFLRERSQVQLARDALDIVVVYYVCYRALLVLRGTRALQVGVGLGAVFLLYVAAHLLQLVTLLTILSALVSSILLIIVVVFQADIRRGLMRVGAHAWLGAARQQESRVIDEVVQAATALARHRVGAIIAFEQEANLDEFVGANRGTELDAAISAELLVALFVPEGMNHLHDGAVIIRNYRLARAGVFFPMPDARVVDQSFGSRHRAALGITEETDAVVVVVSEERGTISFCFNGNIVSNLDGPRLRTMLESIFSPRPTRRPAEAERLPVTPPVAERAVSERPAAPVRISIGAPEEVAPLSRRPPRVEVDLTPPPLRPRLAEAEITGRHATLPEAVPLEAMLPPPLRSTSEPAPAAERSSGIGERHVPPVSERPVAAESTPEPAPTSRADSKAPVAP